MEQFELDPGSSDETGFGIQELDAADRRLIELAQGLNQAIAAGCGREELLRLMSRLVLDAIDHFEMEERILSERAYPTVKGHAALHLQMKAEFEHALEAMSDARVHAMWAEYGILVKQLVVDHFQQETMKYRAFLHLGSGFDSSDL